MNITHILASELSARAEQINAAIGLLDEGATVPFIARYRKEVTGGLDDTQLRNLAERLQYLRELIDRKATILKSIDEQGKLTPELAAQIEAIDNKTALEDVYLPYKPNGVVEVKGLVNKVNRVWVVGNGAMLSYKVHNKNYWSDVPGNLYINVPEQVLDSQITVLAVLLDGPVKLYRGVGRVIESN